MPELPEVETTVRGLKRKLTGKNQGWRIVNIWTDWPKYFKSANQKPCREGVFKKCVLGEEIKNVSRKGKNILITLSNHKIILIHQKMSGHLLLGKWERRENVNNVDDIWKSEKWIPVPFKDFLADFKNRFIHLIFFLKKDNEETMMALSDMRKFAKVVCGEEKKVFDVLEKEVGDDPTSPKFSFEDFKRIIKSKKGRIKTVLMKQELISGVGNIYSDEALWEAGIHPLVSAEKISDKKLKKLYIALRSILKEAVSLGGTSIDDYRTPKGKKGDYGKKLLVYQKDGEPCPKCGEEIKRIKVGSRSARFCPKCQGKK
jgi:formamidopyrimidine-DNA glycosylase